MVAAEIRVTLPDGSQKTLPKGSTAADLAKAIGPGLAKAALAARVNDQHTGAQTRERNATRSLGVIPLGG